MEIFIPGAINSRVWEVLVIYCIFPESTYCIRSCIRYSNGFFPVARLKV